MLKMTIKVTTVYFLLTLLIYIGFNIGVAVAAPIAQYFSADKAAALTIDEKTGQVIDQYKSTQKRHPASLTKLMTIYLTFESIRKGELNWNTPMSVSAEAASRPQTNLSLKQGDFITVKDAVRGLIVRSANDAAVVLAERIAGNEKNFAKLMNKRAKYLQMHHTNFANASGLHDSKQYSTAIDMAKLALALKKHYPQYYHLFAQEKFTFRGKTYTTHNRVLKKYVGATGFKTGYVNASGFNVISSAMRNGKNIMAIIMGAKNSKARYKIATKMLDKAFAKRLRYSRSSGKNITKIKTADASPYFLDFSNNTTTPPALRKELARAGTKKSPLVYSKNKSTIKPTNKPILASANFVPTPKAKPSQLVVYQKPQQAVAQTKQKATNYDWGIHLGYYHNSKAAENEVIQANLATDNLLDNSQVKIKPIKRDSQKIYEVQLINLTQTQAVPACKRIKQDSFCSVFRMASN